MRIRYVGTSPGQIIPVGYSEVEVAQGGVVELPAEIAEGLLEHDSYEPVEKATTKTNDKAADDKAAASKGDS